MYKLIKELKWRYKNGYFLRFLNIHFMYVDFYNITLSNWHQSGFKGWLSKLSHKSGFTRFMCKLYGYKYD